MHCCKIVLRRLDLTINIAIYVKNRRRVHSLDVTKFSMTDDSITEIQYTGLSVDQLPSIVIILLNMVFDINKRTDDETIYVRFMGWLATTSQTFDNYTFTPLRLATMIHRFVVHHCRHRKFLDGHLNRLLGLDYIHAMKRLRKLYRSKCWMNTQLAEKWAKHIWAIRKLSRSIREYVWRPDSQLVRSLACDWSRRVT
jgi:hypothetical protein